MNPSEPNPSGDDCGTTRKPVPRRYLLTGVGLIVVLLAALFVVPQFMPQEDISDGLVYVIPAGASGLLNAPAIDSAIDIPVDITFAKDETAMISIVNNDAVANRAGPWVIGARQTFTMRFDKPGVYDYVCTVDATESVTITVE